MVGHFSLSCLLAQLLLEAVHFAPGCSNLCFAVCSLCFRLFLSHQLSSVIIIIISHHQLSRFEALCSVALAFKSACAIRHHQLLRYQ